MKSIITKILIFAIFITSFSLQIPTIQAAGDYILVKGSTPEVYLIDQGVRLHIINIDIFIAWGFSWDQVRNISDQEVASFPSGGKLTKLIKIKNKPEVYLVETEIIHHITSPDALYLRGYWWSEISVISDQFLQSLEQGIAIGVPKLVKSNNSPTVYYIFSLFLYPVKNVETFERWGFNWFEVYIVKENILMEYQKRSQISYLIKGQSPRVYLVDKSKKYPIISPELFLAWQFKWQEISQQDDQFVASIPQADKNFAQIDSNYAYIADLDGQSNLSRTLLGAKSPDYYFNFARNVSFLNIVGLTDHSEELSSSDWGKLRVKTEQYNVPGKFITFGGYEWQGNLTSEPAYGHFNVLFDGTYPNSIYRASDNNYNTPDKLFSALEQDSHGLAILAHPSSEPGFEPRQWEFDKNYELKNILVSANLSDVYYADNGGVVVSSQEQKINQELKNQHVIGFSGYYDTHYSEPGKGSITAIVSSNLTRTSIFQALKNRQTYSISGGRILLDYQLNNALMGSQILGPQVQISAKIWSKGKIEKIEIYKNSQIIQSNNIDSYSSNSTWNDTNFFDDAFYYIKVTSADGNGDGRKDYAWSSPIWVTKI